MNRARVQGYESSGEYEVKIVYNASDTDIDGLKAITATCRQYISWECKRASISVSLN